MPTWKELKQRGGEHYKTDGVEPIDLMRAIQPHPSYDAFAVKALCDVIKYASRLLSRGYRYDDAGKILHYTELLMADQQGDAR
jgi:hypothetical protein